MAMAIGVRVAEGWRLGLESLEREIREGVELEVRGRLPADLVGTLYRNGPARHGVYGERYRHWFDGDGMVHAIRLADGRATYRNRFVATAGKAAEDAAGRRIFGGFGTPPAGGPVRRFRNRLGKNAANTNVVFHGGRLLALWEGGRPHRLDPVTLETLGEEDFGGVLASGDTFSAHPKLHAGTGDLWDFGVRYGREATLDLYQGRPDGSLRRAASLPLPFPAMVHDFALTETRAVFVLAPIALPRLPLGLLTGQRSYGESLQWEPALGTQIGVVDLASGVQRWYRTDPFMMFHTVNAWDDGEDVVVDLCAYPDDGIMRFATEIMAGEMRSLALAWPERLRLTGAGAVERRRLSETPLEFPRVAGRALTREHRRIYGVTWNEEGDWLGRPVALDLASDAVEAAPMRAGEYAGECVPVTRAGGGAESEVWLLTLVLNAAENRSELRILDGGDLKAPPVATLPLPHIVPFGFHGNWVREA
jgi:all-trans-8'-apo-beta-carotenal 15,15'-oxygenase